MGETKLPYGYKPLLLYNGEVKCQTSAGKLVNLALSSHAHFKTINDLTPEEIYIYMVQLQAAFQNACSLKRYHEAWKLAELLNNHEHWLYLGKDHPLNHDMHLATIYTGLHFELTIITLMSGKVVVDIYFSQEI